jgi:hypothetical protein
MSYQERVEHPALVHEVLDHNHRLLCATREQNESSSLSSADDESNPTTILRFDVRQASNSGSHGECLLDIRAAMRSLCNDQHAAEGKVATHVVVQNMWIESYSNLSPTDVTLSCKQSNRIKGNFQRTSLAGTVTDDPKHHLFVMHSGCKMTCSPPALVHTASPFCQGRVFKDFSCALEQKNYEQQVINIVGTTMVEYVSPDIRRIDGVYMGTGDWVLDILRNNLDQSEQACAAHFSSDSANNESVSVRVGKKDWKLLRDAINGGIMGNPMPCRAVSSCRSTGRTGTRRQARAAAELPAAPRRRVSVAPERQHQVDMRD